MVKKVTKKSEKKSTKKEAASKECECKPCVCDDKCDCRDKDCKCPETKSAKKENLTIMHKKKFLCIYFLSKIKWHTIITI